VRRLANTAAGIRTQLQSRAAAGDDRRRSAAAAAGTALGIERIIAAPVDQVIGFTAEGEFRSVGLAEQHRARSAQARDDRRITVGYEVTTAQRPPGGYDTPGIERILDRDRQTVQRTAEVSRGRFAVERIGLGAGAFGSQLHHRVDPRIDRLDTRQAGFHRVTGTEFAGTDRRGDATGGPVDKIGHGPII
jgi:hypothetical protein